MSDGIQKTNLQVEHARLVSLGEVGAGGDLVESCG